MPGVCSDHSNWTDECSDIVSKINSEVIEGRLAAGLDSSGKKREDDK